MWTSDSKQGCFRDAAVHAAGEVCHIDHYKEARNPDLAAILAPFSWCADKDMDFSHVFIDMQDFRVSFFCEMGAMEVHRSHESNDA